VAFATKKAKAKVSEPGRTYLLQRAPNPTGPCTTFAFLTAPPDGTTEHFDPAPLASPAFYRVAAP
jgi:hypothetical protein